MFQMSVFNQLKDISTINNLLKEDDLNIISTGSSLMSKNIVLGINKDGLFFLTFIT